MRRLVWGVGALAALAALDAGLGRVLNPYLLQIVMLCGINVILAVSLNLVNGFTGQFSIGHAGFMAVGAYGSAVFSLHVGQRWVEALSAAQVPPVLGQGAALLVALLVGGALAALAGYLVGLPSLRLRGDYLAIVTLGFGEIIRVIILNVDAVGAARGLPGIPGWASFFWVGLGVLAVVLVSRHLALSSHGRALFAIRDDEVAAEALGVDTTRYKVLAFVIGAFFAGIAGALFAHLSSYINPDHFGILKSLDLLIFLYVGGAHSFAGGILGAAVFTTVPEALRLGNIESWRMVVYPLILILAMRFRQSGIMGEHEFGFLIPWRHTAMRLGRGGSGTA